MVATAFTEYQDTEEKSDSVIVQIGGVINVPGIGKAPTFGENQNCEPTSDVQLEMEQGCLLAVNIVPSANFKQTPLALAEY